MEQNNSIFSTSQNRLIFGLISALALATFFIGLFVDVSGDAAKYAAISKNILESGDFINLTIHDEPYEQKPPFMFWLSAIGFWLFGVSNSGFKIIPVLYSFFGIYCTYKLASLLYSKKVGQLSAVFLTFSFLFFLYNVDVHTDLVMMTNIVFALWQLFAYLKFRKPINFIIGFAAIGLAMLTKGPTGGFIPAMAVIVFLISQKKWKELFHPKWLLGIIISLIITTPAVLGLYNQFGIEGVKFFFWTNNAGRIDGTVSGTQNTDYFFYIHTLLYIYAPWCFALYLALFHDFKFLFKKKFSGADFYVFGGMWLFFIILSVAKGKSPNYIAVLVPLMAIILSKWIDAFLSGDFPKLLKSVKIIQFSTVVLLWFLVGFFSLYMVPTNHFEFYIIPAMGLIFTIWIYLKNTDIISRLLAPSMLVVTILFFCINLFILPSLFFYQSSIEATRIYNEHSEENERLYNYKYEQFELYFYSNTEVENIEESERLNEACQKGGDWFFCYEADLPDIKATQAPIDTIYNLKHRGIYNMNLEFMLPESRVEACENTYLVKLK